MPNNQSESLFSRHAGNPILTPAQWPYAVNSVFNPGATRLQDGTTLLLCRVEDHRGLSHLCAARSASGVDHWNIDRVPTLAPADAHPEEAWGVEDPRITYVPELELYVIVYTSYSRAGPGVSLATTPDFVHFERFGNVMMPENKDAALLPCRIQGRWALVHRPISPLGAHIWMAYSPDLRHWGGHRMILQARRGAWWDANKIGLSPPPIETPMGWLMIYHGVRNTPAGCLYRIGLALFEGENPEHCLRRGAPWVFGPQAPYECAGDVGNVVFPCGTTLGPDGDTLHMYYGASDTCIGLATASLGALLAWLMQHGEAPEESVARLPAP